MDFFNPIQQMLSFIKEIILNSVFLIYLVAVSAIVLFSSLFVILGSIFLSPVNWNYFDSDAKFFRSLDLKKTKVCNNVNSKIILRSFREYNDFFSYKYILLGDRTIFFAKNKNNPEAKSSIYQTIISTEHFQEILESIQHLKSIEPYRSNDDHLSSDYSSLEIFDSEIINSLGSSEFGYFNASTPEEYDEFQEKVFEILQNQSWIVCKNLNSLPAN